jgi:hypothetical protein
MVHGSRFMVDGPVDLIKDGGSLVLTLVLVE